MWFVIFYSRSVGALLCFVCSKPAIEDCKLCFPAGGEKLAGLER